MLKVFENNLFSDLFLNRRIILIVEQEAFDLNVIIRFINLEATVGVGVPSL